MNRTQHIIDQRAAGLISASEARASLRRLAKQSRFDADYSDSPASYKRFDREAKRAATFAEYSRLAVLV